MNIVRRGTTRARSVAAAAVAAALVAAPFAGAAAAPGCGTDAGEGWTVLPKPAPLARIEVLEVDPRTPARMLATDGSKVARTVDGGCGWDVVASMSAGRRVTSIEIPESGAGTGAYLTVVETAGPATIPHVYRSSDAGASFEPADTGLPPAGAPIALRVPRAAPATVYLGIGVGGLIDLLYASTDGGSTWQLRSSLSQQAGTKVADIQVDALEPDSVWASSNGGLFHSTDGGRSFTGIDEFAQTGASLVDVNHTPGQPANVLGFRPGAGGLMSQDGGRTWFQVGAPPAPTSVAHGPAPTSRVVTAGGEMYAYLPTVLNWVDMRAPVDGLTGAEADLATQPSFYGHSADRIAVYSGAPGRLLDFDRGGFTMPDVSLLDPGVTPPTLPGELSPARRALRVPVGVRRSVEYRLRVPRSQTPLDVYFLLDTSDSMKPFLQEMSVALQDIVNGLVASGIDVQFGMAQFRDYPTALRGPGEQERSFVYRQDQDIAPTTAGIEAALESVQPGGGGHYNAQLAALLQTATGQGEEVFPPGPGNDVPPGLQADFRRNALRVVLMVNDSEFVEQRLAVDRNDPTAPDDLPQFEEVAAALRDRSILPVGISLRKASTARGTTDMQRLATATGALAPAGGVDCDGDGAPDIAGGGPLVCELDESEIASADLVPAMVNLVEAVRTRAEVGLELDDPHGVVLSVSPESYRALVLQERNVLGFRLEIRCPAALAGREVPVGLGAPGIDGAPRAQLEVRCVGSGPEDPGPNPLERVLAITPVIAAPPPPPVPNTVTSAQAQAQGQSQAQAQAAVAAQEQEQPQVAFVHAMHAAAKEEYAMSSLRRNEPVMPPAALYGSALVMSLGFGIALAGRRWGLQRARR